MIEHASMSKAARVRVTARRPEVCRRPLTPRSAAPSLLHAAGRPMRRRRIPAGFHRLKWNELVSQGDFVADRHFELHPWEGPGGFLAGSFAHPVYRKGRAKTLKPITATKLNRNPV